jgi:hypothetical protein
MDGIGQFWAILSSGVLGIVVLALAVCVQTLRAHDLQQTLSSYIHAWDRLRTDLNIQVEMIRTLQSALRAESAHVAQLQRKVLLMQELLNSAYETEERCSAEAARS